MKAELLILGVLHRGDFHPYEIKRRLLRAMVECYTDVDVGTLYYAIRRLQKTGHIRIVQRERVRRGGMRTVYGLTAAGKRRFRELLHDQFSASGSIAETLYGAMLFLHFADSAVVAERLRERLARQDEAIAKIASVRRELGPLLASGGRHLLEHLDRQRRLDRKWLQEVLAEVVAGRVHDVRDPKSLAES